MFGPWVMRRFVSSERRGKMITVIVLAFSLATIYVGWAGIRERKGNPLPGYKYGMVLSVAVFVVGLLLVVVLHL